MFGATLHTSNQTEYVVHTDKLMYKSEFRWFLSMLTHNAVHSRETSPPCKIWKESLTSKFVGMFFFFFNADFLKKMSQQEKQIISLVQFYGPGVVHIWMGQ